MFSAALKENIPYELVILDVTVRGGKGGEETFKAIHAIDASTKVIVASGYSESHIMSNYQEYGFAGRLAKPFEYEELERLLKRVCSQKT